MIDNEIKIAKLVNKYFANVVTNLGIFTKNKSATFAEVNLNGAEMALKYTKTILV